MTPSRPHHPVTPDGRYFVLRGRLWRMSDPALQADRREQLAKELMAARRKVDAMRRAGDQGGESAARKAVDRAKRALSERSLVWWHDGSPDLNRHMARTMPYAEWFARLGRN